MIKSTKFMEGRDKNKEEGVGGQILLEGRRFLKLELTGFDWKDRKKHSSIPGRKDEGWKKKKKYFGRVLR